MQTYDQFVDAAFVRIVRQTPEMAARMGLAGLPQFKELAAKLDDRSVAADFARRELLDEIFAEHRRYESGLTPLPQSQPLSRDERLTFEVFDFFLRYLPFEPWAGTAGREFVLHHYPVRHVWGAPADTFNTAINMHSLATVEDAEAFVERLAQLAPVMRDLIAGLEHRHGLGLSPPRAAIAIVRGELEAIIGAGVDDNELLDAFDDKLDEVGLDANGALRQKGRALVDALLRGPLTDLATGLRRLEMQAAEPPGVWRLPRGDEFYRYCLTRETSRTMSPDELYTLGESEVARLRSELEHDVAGLGFGGSDLRGSLGAALRVAANGGDSEAHRSEIVDYYARLLDDTSARIRPLFGKFPRARCVVRPSPRHLEARRTTTYFPASAGGEYPGWLELCVLRELGKAPWARHATAYHEAWPGHHLQLSLAQEASHLSLFRRTFVLAAFLEGWAKYAERLPFETGIDTEPRYELQRKAQELISASNLMLDVGVHDRRWTREQAVTFSMEQALIDRSMAEYLVDRVSVTPAQTTSYMIGLNEVRRLKARMQKDLGERFTLPAFHDRLLGEGALPLSVLRSQFEEAPR
jgi:uncharacterized protein (DUF885 family)